MSPEYLHRHVLHAFLPSQECRGLLHSRRPWILTDQPMILICTCSSQAPDVPLDVLGAESEGQIGYLLETALAEALPESEVALHTSVCYLKSWCSIAKATSEAAHETPHTCIHDWSQTKKALETGWRQAALLSDYRERQHHFDSWSNTTLWLRRWWPC